MINQKNNKFSIKENRILDNKEEKLEMKLLDNLLDKKNIDDEIHESNKELKYHCKNEVNSNYPKNEINQNKYNNYSYGYNSFNDNNKVLNYELSQNIGFINLGHTCYMNSFLQILLHTPNFLPKIKELYYNKVNKNTLIYNLIKLSEYPHDSQYLKEIKKTIAKTFPKYGEYIQNDTQNFAIDFIDTMINEIKEETSFMSDSNDKDDSTEINNINDNILYKTKKCKAFLTEFEK